MVVEVGPEIEQLVFEVCRRPEQHVIQVFPPQGADQPFYEWMGQGDVGDGLDFYRLQYPQIGLPLVEPIERIIVRAEVLRHPALPTNGAVEHPTECGTIDRSRMHAESNDPARELIQSMTTRTQWDRKVAGSHLNRSILQRLSFICPRKVSQEGPPESCPGR